MAGTLTTRPPHLTLDIYSTSFFQEGIKCRRCKNSHTKYEITGLEASSFLLVEFLQHKAIQPIGGYVLYTKNMTLTVLCGALADGLWHSKQAERAV